MDTQIRREGLFNIIDDEIDNGLIMIETDRLIGFGDHIFAPYPEVDMLELMKSIEIRGLLTPIIIRDHPIKNGMFEILAGHNRVTACNRLGIGAIHARIMDNVSDNEAKLIVIETNLFQRNMEDFKLSHRARIIAEWHALMKKQGLRTDLLKEIENIDVNPGDKGEEKPFHLGKSQIWNYVKINDCLSDGLKDLMDVGKLPIKSAVELSYLEQEDQELVRNFIFDGNRISDAKAKAIKKMAMERGLTKESLKKLILPKEKDKKKEFMIPNDLLDKYFDNTEEYEIRNILELALSVYFENRG
ncbi:ParB/RepB/Spo0J family partition protein [Acetobacterium bakii]|uniref:ParB/RepB/Spo0J family partition protein n=1 Tax=Acetobacterium bakii TaxID=52689 RepID=UPI00067FEC6B|nr:ParB N-terminal domain-containing protein [Acetobacterium bakii]